MEDRLVARFFNQDRFHDSSVSVVALSLVNHL
jgi:hypothetical protein